MTKQKALKQIEKLKKFVEELDKNPKKLVRTINDTHVKLNGRWGMEIFCTEEQGDEYEGCEVSGHKASAFLADCHGTWYTAEGRVVRGYLYFKPHGE